MREGSANWDMGHTRVSISDGKCDYYPKEIDDNKSNNKPGTRIIAHGSAMGSN